MHRTSRPGRSGTSRAALLLGCAGAGAALVLGLVVTRGESTRAAAPLTAPLPEPALEAGAPLDPAGQTELVATEGLPDAPAPVETVAPAPAALAPEPLAAGVPAAAALAASTTEPKVEGPALRYVKGEGGPEKLAKGAVRAESRERLKEQRAKDAERAAATGEVRPSPATKPGLDDERRAKIERRKRREPPNGG